MLEASDRLVLQHYLGSAAVARYAVAYNIGAIPILLLGVLDTVWMPRVFAVATHGCATRCSRAVATRCTRC